MSLAILGMGTANPPYAVAQHEALAVARALGGPELLDGAWLDSMYANSGVTTRRQVFARAIVEDAATGGRTTRSPWLPDADGWRPPSTAERMATYAAEAAPLAIDAARQALAAARVAAARITHLITVSCTGFAAPGVDVALIGALALRPTVLRTHIGFMGCHGAINGLRVAQAFAADPAATVLLAAVELCSLHYCYGPAAPDKLVANALFADGAAALVGRHGDGAWRVDATASCLFPDSERAMAWTVGDQGFEMTLSKLVPKAIAARLRPWMDAWLAERNLSVEQIGSWAIHPGGPKILAAAEDALGLPPAATAAARAVFAELGNMSSPTVLFIIDRLRRADAPRPCVALGFGPGLVAEAALLL